MFPDRVELVLRIMNETIVIPAQQIRGVYLVPGGIIGALTGTLQGRYPVMALIWGWRWMPGFFCSRMCC